MSIFLKVDKLQIGMGEEILDRGEKEYLPSIRTATQFSMHLEGHKIFVRISYFPNGKIGELFIDMDKTGSNYRSMLTCFAMAVSIGLQYGVPIETFIEAFVHTRFEPSGETDYPSVRKCSSPLDLVFRIIGAECLERKDLER